MTDTVTAHDHALRRVVSDIFWMARRYAECAGDPGFDLLYAAAKAHGVDMPRGKPHEGEWAVGAVAAPDPLPPLTEVAARMHLMARRYADGRATYATSRLNDATRTLLELGVTLPAQQEDATVFAADGMGEGFDGLAAAERANALASPWRAR